MSSDFEKWIGPAEDLLRQAYYRILGIISYHAPLSEAYKACEVVAGKRGGNLYWVVKDVLAKWEDVEVYPGITMSLWILGGPTNTIYVRTAWWKLYVLESLTRATAKVLG
jgi:hypothetical protein